jgi:hypothetical protein
VVQHHKWSGKNCPAELRGTDWDVIWNEFLDRVRNHLHPYEDETLQALPCRHRVCGSALAGCFKRNRSAQFGMDKNFGGAHHRSPLESGFAGTAADNDNGTAEITALFLF